MILEELLNIEELVEMLNGDEYKSGLRESLSKANSKMIDNNGRCLFKYEGIVVLKGYMQGLVASSDIMAKRLRSKMVVMLL